MTQAALSTEEGRAGVFYRCADGECGLRFPAAAGETFDGRCPRCGAATQVAAVTTPAVASGSAALEAVAPGGAALHLLLDNWRSLFNVGAAFRTADGAGVGHLYLCGITATPAQRKLAKTALGAEAAVPWSYHADAVMLAATLRQQGAQVWALEATDRAEPLAAVRLPRAGGPVVLVAGNEVVGCDPGLLAVADRVVCLPMRGVKRSLNVAVALSVAVYWLMVDGM